MDASQFRVAAKQMVDYIADYLENIRERPVLPSVDPFYMRQLIPNHAPEKGEEWSAIFKDIERVIMPGVTHWHHPNFHAYFPTGNSYPAILADMLSDAIGCIGFTWIASPACTELEMIVIDWLAQMLELPNEFLFTHPSGKGGGVIAGTASEATLVTLLAARNKSMSASRARGQSFDEETIQSRLVCYASEHSHSSVERASLLGGCRIHLVKTDEKTLSLRGDALELAIAEDRERGLLPFFVVGTLGTTSTCAFDRLDEIGPICQREGLWLHIDAAYAGSAFVCPEFRHHLAGIQYADSFSMNPHKWLLVNFDCSALWMKDCSHVVDAFNVNPVYLRHEMQGKVPDYRHWQIPLGRRFRSLKMWFVFRSYGITGLQAHIRKHVALAKEFTELLKSDIRFELLYPSGLGLVCFRIKATNEANELLAKRINDHKRIHITPTKIDGNTVLRFAVCARTTESEDIHAAFEEITEQTTAVLRSFTALK